MPLVWASRILGTPFPERVAGSSLIRTLTAAAAGAGRSVYFLGGAPGTAKAAAEVLTRACPDLTVAGTACPEFGFEKDERRVEAIGRDLAAARPDIVFAALGSPKQERLIARLRPLLPKAWWLGVGISLSYVCDHVRRAPPLVRALGLEWLYRLLQEPGRLAKRYLLEDLPFALRLFGAAIAGRVRGGRP
jgi:N-acetylglucosaminyldiphosphoundecaprenol N-acetyl-beta-D-mannosaminyltransferase